MAIRRWAARPDQVLTVRDGDGQPVQIPVVSREQMREAFLDGEALVAQSGGFFTVSVGRARTDVAQEMVTTHALFEWKDRVDAKPQPEAPVQAEPVLDVEQQLADLDAELEAAEAEGQEVVEGDVVGDVEEDLSSIPVGLRGTV